FLPVAAREVRYGADDALVPQELVREQRDVAHVDAGADDGAAAGDDAQRRGHELAGRREDDRRVELLGSRLVRRAGPLAAELERERRCSVVSRTHEAEDALPLVAPT